MPQLFPNQDLDKLQMETPVTKAFSSDVEHVTVKKNAAKQRVAFSSDVEHIGLKNSAANQRVRALF